MGEYILNSTLTAGECLRRLRDASDYDGFMGCAGSKPVMHLGGDRCLRLVIRNRTDHADGKMSFVAARVRVRDDAASTQIHVSIGLRYETRGFLAILSAMAGVAICFAIASSWSHDLINAKSGYMLCMSIVCICASVLFMRDISRPSREQEEFLVEFIKAKTRGPQVPLAIRTIAYEHHKRGASPSACLDALERTDCGALDAILALWAVYSFKHTRAHALVRERPKWRAECEASERLTGEFFDVLIRDAETTPHHSNQPPRINESMSDPGKNGPAR